ncbi:MAG: hypothetical protein WA924_10785 [Burkholderiaceae bacterium]
MRYARASSAFRRADNPAARHARNVFDFLSMPEKKLIAKRGAQPKRRAAAGGSHPAVEAAHV